MNLHARALVTTLSMTVFLKGAFSASPERLGDRSQDPSSRVLVSVAQYGAVPDGKTLSTNAIQKAIDSCAERGGGTVRFPEGTFLCGRLTMKSHVTLHLEKGALLKGSDDYRDYGKGEWYDAMIRGVDVVNVRFTGEGIIDGVDCRNPKGEEGFRGPHGIALTRCRNIMITGITIRRAANYAVICRECTDARIENMAVRGGHDGVNAWNSARFTIKNCDLRTGDDAIAGTNNTDFTVVNCRLNTSCNGFRFAGKNLIVRDCRIWGPGEHKHLVSKRTNLLAAFVHFSPGKGKKSDPVSDNWVIENVTVENANHFYLYDYDRGLWQTVRPVKKICFRNVRARGIRQPVLIKGDGQVEFVLDNVTIDFAHKKVGQEGIKPATAEDGYAFNIRKAARVELRNVTVTTKKILSMPVLCLENVNRVVLSDFRYTETTNGKPIIMRDVGDEQSRDVAPLTLGMGSQHGTCDRGGIQW